MNATATGHIEPTPEARIEDDLAMLADHADEWSKRSIRAKVRDLEAIVAATDRCAGDWVDAACGAKRIAAGSPLAGEEWTSGPWAVITGAQAYARTLRAVADGADPLAGLPTRLTADGSVAIQVFPGTTFDRLLLNRYRAEVWMQPEVGMGTLSEHVAEIYQVPPGPGSVALVLGAGNIASIPPLDVMHELFVKGSVAIVKLNPVNDYLGKFLEIVFAQLIEAGFVRIVYGGAEVGSRIVDDPAVDSVHITGSSRTHDAIVFGTGEEGERAKRDARPRLTKPITSELGGVGPTIVVPGPWDKSDITHQAVNLASMKTHNAGFNCIALQVVILSEQWPSSDDLIDQAMSVVSGHGTRYPYYPGAQDRLADLTADHPDARVLGNGDAPPTLIRDVDADSDDPVFTTEAFGGAFATTKLRESDPGAFLDAAVEFCNDRLAGTLGVNILIHPKTQRALGVRFDEALARLRYGTIGVNCWNAVGYLLADVPWGAHPGHELNDVQSGIGTVHNGLMLTDTAKAVVSGPFRTFPQSITHGDLNLATLPPWFVTHKRADVLGERLTHFSADPSWGALPALFVPALLATRDHR